MKYRRKRFKERTRMPHMERLLSEKEFARAPLRCETTRFTIRRKEIHEEEETEKTLLRSIPRVYFRSPVLILCTNDPRINPLEKPMN